MIDISWKFPKWLEKVQKQEKRINLFIAAQMQTNRAELFDAEGAFNGHAKWKDLKSGKNKKLDSDGVAERQILSKSGKLRKSIGPNNDGITPTRAPGGIVKMSGDTVTIGTNLIYAAIHNNGGVVKFPGTKNGFGRGIVIGKHDIPIPKRNFSSLTKEDAAEILAAYTNLIKDILNE